MNAEAEKNVELDVVDIEEWSKEKGGKPPKAKKYKIRVDREKYDVDAPSMTGRGILELAGKTPVERYLLNQRMKGGQVAPVGLDQVVDFTEPGIERFMTLPKDQTEGAQPPRREFVLPESDVESLDAMGMPWETLSVGNGAWFLLHEWETHEHFTEPVVSVAVQIPSGYPAAALDMAFFHPPVVRKDGKSIPNANASITVDGKTWQRWSRHYTAANPWKPGEYNLLTHLQLVRAWLEREVQRHR